MAISDFPRVLTHLRKEMGISQKKAAEELGISQALLSHYEKGIRECGLLFLVRAADFYGVSVDYLLGRSLERSGASIRVEEVPDEDAAGQGNRGGSMMTVLNKKLICNSVTVVEAILGKIGDRDLINKVSLYLQISVYQMFRRIYNANEQNPQTFFGAEADSYSMMADSTMKKLEAEIQGRLKKILLPALDEESLRAEYPLFATSLLNLLQNAETAIGGRKK